MSDTLRDQLMGLGFKPAPVPEKPARPHTGPTSNGATRDGRPMPADRAARAGRHAGQAADRGARPDHRGDARTPRRDGRPAQGARPADGARPPRPAGAQLPRPAVGANAPRTPGGGPGRARGPQRPREDIDLAKAYAIRAQREKDDRVEAERVKQEQARLRREAKAAVAELVKGRALNDPDADVARHFEYGGKIKRVYLNAAQLAAVNRGELGVLQLDGRYLVVDAALLREAEALFAPAVALKVDPAAPVQDDPYADDRYRVPDDLVW